MLGARLSRCSFLGLLCLTFHLKQLQHVSLLVLLGLFSGCALFFCQVLDNVHEDCVAIVLLVESLLMPLQTSQEVTLFVQVESDRLAGILLNLSVHGHRGRELELEATIVDLSLGLSRVHGFHLVVHFQHSAILYFSFTTVIFAFHFLHDAVDSLEALLEHELLHVFVEAIEACFVSGRLGGTLKHALFDQCIQLLQLGRRLSQQQSLYFAKLVLVDFVNDLELTRRPISLHLEFLVEDACREIDSAGEGFLIHGSQSSSNCCCLVHLVVGLGEIWKQLARVKHGIIYWVFLWFH